MKVNYLQEEPELKFNKKPKKQFKANKSRKLSFSELDQEDFLYQKRDKKCHF